MNTTVQFEDTITMPSPSSRTVTRDGYLVTGGVLARAGIFNYRADELGLTDAKRKADDLVAVFRSREELERAAESFESQPITLDHQWTTSANWRSHAVGDVRDVEMHDEAMVGSLIVRDKGAVEKISDGRSQLSNGYRATLIRKPGTWRGQEYEYEQIGIMGNHVAVVDKSRCGFACSIADSQPQEKTMESITHYGRYWRKLQDTSFTDDCACGGSCEECKERERERLDPRQAAMERQSNAWKYALGEPVPDDDEEEPEEDDDPRQQWINRHEQFWKTIYRTAAYGPHEGRTPR